MKKFIVAALAFGFLALSAGEASAAGPIRTWLQEKRAERQASCSGCGTTQSTVQTTATVQTQASSTVQFQTASGYRPVQTAAQFTGRVFHRLTGLASGGCSGGMCR